MSKVYQVIASAVVAMQNCEKSGNREWFERHQNRIADIVRDYMPSGSGFDSGTQFRIDEAKPDRLTFDTSFHHMDDNGSYNGWSDHSVVITPSFAGFDMRITGRDRNGIKEYIAQAFDSALNSEVL